MPQLSGERLRKGREQSVSNSLRSFALRDKVKPLAVNEIES